MSNFHLKKMCLYRRSQIQLSSIFCQMLMNNKFNLIKLKKQVGSSASTNLLELIFTFLKSVL